VVQYGLFIEMLLLNHKHFLLTYFFRCTFLKILYDTDSNGWNSLIPIHDMWGKYINEYTTIFWKNVDSVRNRMFFLHSGKFDCNSLLSLCIY